MTWNKVKESFHLQTAQAEPADQSCWLGWDGWVCINDTENFAIPANSRKPKSP